MNEFLVIISSLILSAIAGIIIWRKFRTGHLASPVSLIFALVSVHFVVPVFAMLIVPGLSFRNIHNEYFLGVSLFYLLCCVLFFIVGAALVTNNVRSQRLLVVENDSRKRIIRWNDDFLLLASGGLLFAGWLARLSIIYTGGFFQIDRTEAVEMGGVFHAAFAMLELFPQFVLCMLAIRAWRTFEPSVFWLKYTIVIVFFELAYWVPSGRKEEVVITILIPFIVRYICTVKMPSRKVLVTFVVLITLLIPVTFIYRAALTEDNFKQATSVRTKTAISSVLTEKNRLIGAYSFSGLVWGRFSLLEPISASVRLIEAGKWELKLGQSYVQVLLGFVPRFVWPEKPNLHYGNKFGRDSGILGARDYNTSISVTYPGEAYLNFGWFGVLIFLVFGFLYEILYRQIWKTRHRETWLLMYSITLPTLLYIGGTAALHFGGLVKLLPLFYIIGRLLEVGGRNNE